MKHTFKQVTALLLVICMVMGLLYLDTGVVRAVETNTTNTVSVTVYVGRTYTITDDSGNYETTYDSTGLNTGVATVTVSGTTIPETTTTTYEVTKVISATNDYNYYVGVSDGDDTRYLVLSDGGTISYTTDITEATEFTWTNEYGNRYLKSGSYYLRYNNGTWSATTSRDGGNGTQNATNFKNYSDGYLYINGGKDGTSTGYSFYTMTDKTETVAASEATTIAITGVAAGTTSVVVGDTTYNITVKADAPTSFTGTVNIAGGASTTVTLAALDGGYGDFSEDDYSIVWETADSTIADVYGTSITGASIIGHKAGNTTVTATVYYKGTDTVVATYTWTVTVTSTSSSTGSSTINLTATVTVTNGRIYYSVTGTTVQEATLTSETTDANGNTVRTYSIDTTAYYSGSAILCFFVAPDEGYALTSIADNGETYGQYYVLDPETNTVTVGSGHQGGTLGTYMTDAEIQAMVAQAVAYGCEVIYWNTRSSSDSFTYKNYCNKLPTVSKDITSVTHNCDESGETEAYVDGETTIEVGDVITYTITVYTYYENANITYSNVTLTDTMSGQVGSPSWTTETVNVSTWNNTTQSSSTETGYSTTVTYTVQEKDINNTITNTVALSYDYYTSYEEGSYSSAATAEATITITSFYPKGLVVDYGLPMVINYSESHGYGKLTSGTANYGTVTVEDNVVTYTPTSILTGVDTVTLTATLNSKETTYTFNVYPATTVYYEEGFATYGTGWDVTTSSTWSSTDNKGSSTQEAHVANDTNTSAASTYYNYGYDNEAYASDTTGSEGTAASTTTVADSLQFTFTGTGVDIFANCDSGSGRVAIRIAEKDSGTIKKFLFVDMANTGDYSSGDGTTAYNTPIASVSGLDYGSYTVTIYLVTANSSGFQFDGFRVYDTIQQSETAPANEDKTDPYTIQTTVYYTDDEDYPDYYELRNNVLAGLSVDNCTSTSDYADDLSDSLAQVYASSETTGAIVTYDSDSDILKNDGTTEVTSETVQSLLDDGPKNELYLYSGGSVVFKITTNREVQIGMRSVTGAEVSYTISAVNSNGETIQIAGSTDSGTLTSSVDMFYDLVDKDSNGEEATYTITIKNTGSSGVLSITDIKVCDSNDGSFFEELTAEDLVAALTAAAADEEEMTADGDTSQAGETDEEETASGDASQSGETDEGTTTGGDTQANETVEPAVTYADATLTVNLTDYTGSVIASTSLTENGVEGEETAFAASDILSAVEEVLPTGYALVSEDDITDRTAVYGENGSLTLQIGKVATLTVSCVKYTGLFRTSTVATFTLTKVQTSRTSRATFSAGEIKAAIPADCRALLVTSASVNYGSSGSKTVTVY